MAEITRGSTKGFIFGQNMEDRVVKPLDSEDEKVLKSEEKHSDGNEGEILAPGSCTKRSAESVLRPTLLKSNVGSGPAMIAPSRLGNPFVTGQATSASDNTSANILSTGNLANNPFAEKPPAHAISTGSSDNEDERKEKPIVAPSHFVPTNQGPFGHAGFSGNSHSATKLPNRFMLRPSALDKQTVNFNKGEITVDANESYKSSFRLEPAKLQSPLSKGKTSEKSDEKNKENQGKPSDSVTSEASDLPDPVKERLFGDTENHDTNTKENSTTSVSQSFKTEDKSSKESKSHNNGSDVAFTQTSQKITNTKAAEKDGSSFIFGQNLAGRVLNTPQKTADPDGITAKPDDTPGEGSLSPNKSLEESAAAEQAKYTRPSFQQVEVKTGEEDESNVFQLNAKLYVFEKATQTWVERGRGQLRLNDMCADDSTSKSFQSRLVIRTTGSLRVVLNTKIWAGMTIERASQKSIRLTAVDGDDGIKIFLIMAQPKDADQIFSAIDWRVQQLKQQEFSKQQYSPNPAESSHEQSQKREADSPDDGPKKKQRVELEPRPEGGAESSNDSGTVDPETEVSNESFASSPTVKSSSSDA